MKRLVFCGFLFCALVLEPTEVVKVRAQVLAGCPTRLQYDPTDWNPEIDQVVRVQVIQEKPEYPIVIGQDPDKRGVDIMIDIEAIGIPMVYTYEVSVIGPCLAHLDPPLDSTTTSCGIGYDHPYYYYRQIETDCRPESVNASRSIDVDSLQVWLEPEEKTIRWLGNKSSLGEGKNLLRSLFPEDWSFGTWAPGGAGFQFDPQEGYQFTVPAIEKYAAEHPGFNFLKANPAYDVYHSYKLPKVTDQHTNGKEVLGLFGAFEAGVSDRSGYGDVLKWNGGCLYDEVDGAQCKLPLWLPADVTDFYLNLLYVPLDLPGTWKVGLYFRMKPARYMGIEEPSAASEDLEIHEDNGYQEVEEFDSYIWLTTPCNPEKGNSCTNVYSSFH